MTTNTTQTDLHAPAEKHTSSTAAPPPGQKKGRGMIWAIAFVIIFAVGGYAVWRASQPVVVSTGPGGRGGGGGGRGRGGLGPVPVAVAKVERKAWPVYLNGLGNVIAFYTVTVKSRVDGQIMKFDVNEGDLVKEGQVVAEIDPRPYQVQLDLAQGALARDSALLADAKLDLQRYQTLVATDAVPKQQLDTQTYLVAQYEGNIKTDQANIDSARLNLTYAKVTAPISGVVGLRQVDPGNVIHATDATGIIVITQLDPIAVDFTIPEDSLPQVLQKLRAGAKLPVDAYTRDNSQKLASGTLLTLDNQIDPTTGTSKMKAVFDNKDGRLFPSQFVNIRLLVNTLSDQLVIPTVAVQNGQQGSFVYVVDAPGQDQTATVHLRPVQVLMSDQSGAVIKSGLEEGEQVAVDGADRLQDGAVARVRRPGEEAAEAAADAAALSRGRGRAGKKGGKKGGGQ